MAEIEQVDDQPPPEEEGDCTTNFQWDENTQLFFHSSTGFYYSPTGDWYYSSRDGLYYKFENGNYVLLDTAVNNESEVNSGEHGNASSHLVEGLQCTNVASEKDGQIVAEMSATVIPDPATADLERLENHQIEEPSPTSEWLEDTLIELFLSNYPRHPVSRISDDLLQTTESYDKNTVDATADGDTGNHELEEGEWISEENNSLIVSNGNVADQGTSLEEENWKAQYGQVSQPNEAASVSGFHILDLWDWELVPGILVKDGTGHEARVTGRLVKHSSKLHPSLPSRGTRLKTSPVCEVHADLVRVKSGQIYRLKRPSRRYLESLSVYDSSNPTGGWGYPELSVSTEMQPFPEHDGQSVHTEAVISSNHTCASNKDKSTAYRDRAAERRAFHGGFGIGPGQKKPYDAAESSSPCSTTDANPEVAAAAAAESLNMSFGSGSYARRLLQNMGWKEDHNKISSTPSESRFQLPGSNTHNAKMEKPTFLLWLIIFAGFNLLNRIKAAESPQYTVTHSESDFEVRLYRESVWMTAPAHEISFEKATKDGYHRLFQFAEGANLNSSRIPLTWPFLTSIVPNAGPLHSSAYYVRLYLPLKFQATPPLPLPELSLVPIRWTSHCIAVRKFSGFARDENIVKEAERLAVSLNQSEWANSTSSSSDYAYSIAQYNSPLKFVGRLNEVWVDVDGSVENGCKSSLVAVY